MEKACFCDSGLGFAHCCQPILTGEMRAVDAKALMRSRYSAYCTEQFDYILQTYGASARANLTIDDLKKSAQGTQWLALQVMQTGMENQLPFVEFKAFFKAENQLQMLHERSFFDLEDDRWLYTHGMIFDDSGELKYDRNKPCFCASGKKFKRCCYLA